MIVRDEGAGDGEQFRNSQILISKRYSWAATRNVWSRNCVPPPQHSMNDNEGH